MLGQYIEFLLPIFKNNTTLSPKKQKDLLFLSPYCTWHLSNDVSFGADMGSPGIYNLPTSCFLANAEPNECGHLSSSIKHIFLMVKIYFFVFMSTWVQSTFGKSGKVNEQKVHMLQEKRKRWYFLPYSSLLFSLTGPAWSWTLCLQPLLPGTAQTVRLMENGFCGGRTGGR